MSKIETSNKHTTTAGCIGWYIPILVDLIQKLGSGFAARGASYAGHSGNEKLVSYTTDNNDHDDKGSTSNDENRDVSIAWTVDGQIEHKCSYINHILSEIKSRRKSESSSSSSRPKIIFLSHSIGSHMVERILLLRPDILYIELLVLYILCHISEPIHSLLHRRS